MSFEKELESLINKYSQENNSNTPDFILAEYLSGCLKTWNESIKKRDNWYSEKRMAIKKLTLDETARSF